MNYIDIGYLPSQSGHFDYLVPCRGKIVLYIVTTHDNVCSTIEWKDSQFCDYWPGWDLLAKKQGITNLSER